VRCCSEQKSTSKKQSAGTPAKAGGKRGQKKDDEWEEVSRKYVVFIIQQYLYACRVLCFFLFAETSLHGSHFFACFLVRS